MIGVQVPSTGTGSVSSRELLEKEGLWTWFSLAGFSRLELFRCAPFAFAQREEAFHQFTLSAGDELRTIAGTDAGKLDGNLLRFGS